MATLADAFLADFDDDEEEFEEKDEHKLEGEDQLDAWDDELAATVEVRDMDMDSDDEDQTKAMDVSESVDEVSQLVKSTDLKQHIETIEQRSNETMDFSDGHVGKSLTGGASVTRSAEYELIVKSNDFTRQIDEEIMLIHKFLRDLYSTKLKDLEQIVPNPTDYSRVIKKIGNETDITKVDLSDILPQHTILTITVTASAATGSKLTDEDLHKVTEAADAIILLDGYRQKIFEYVESRMDVIAPNLSAIVGPEIAARLVGVAGGLENLAQMPSCNVQVLGHTRKSLAGFASTSIGQHMGLLAFTQIMLTTPNGLKNKALRLLAAKCVLAARVDSHQDDSDGSMGRDLREVIEKKIAKWQEPPPPKRNKALPIPGEFKKKKRGGRRYRKQKEQYQQTDVQKQRNRVIFGVAEITDDFTGESYGMLGVAGSGKLRVQKSKNKQKLVGKAKKQMERLRSRVRGASSGQVSGLASTIALTPAEGMELVNPDAGKELETERNQKYFSTTASFVNVGKRKAQGAAGGANKKAKPPVPKF